MTRPWAHLDEKDRATFRAAIAFLHKRLAEQATIDWALGLKPEQRIERIAIDDLLNSPGAGALKEPWATAWRLIEESWSIGASVRGDGTAIYGIQQRLRRGERSGAVVSAVVSLVAPRLKVSPLGSWRWQFVRKPRQPKTFDHLVSARLTSGNLINLNVLELHSLTDVRFLSSLASALEAAVNHGLDIARRLGCEEQWQMWQLGGLGRVYYVTPTRPGGEDPDSYHDGIAPSVKLLYAVVARIAELDPSLALSFVQRWSVGDSPVSIRLWAAIARNDGLCASEQIGAFLSGLDDRIFWDLNMFPEIAELRAERFGGLHEKTQRTIVARLRKGPPRDQFPKKADAQEVKKARLYWAVRELRRVELFGGELPARSKSWLDAQVAQFSDLAAMTIDEGFPRGPTVRSVPRNPDDRYNTLEGVARLRELEKALSTSRGGPADDPAGRGTDWLQERDSAVLVLGDLEAAEGGGDDFPRVWNLFGWAHSPSQPEREGVVPRDLQREGERVLALLNQLSERTIATAIEGISAWLDVWSTQVVNSPIGLPVWLRVWPIAAEATNARPHREDDADLSVVARAVDDDHELMDLDTLNTPAGRLVGVFLAECRKLPSDSEVFSVGSTERHMRDAMIASIGRSGLIARHRLIESLPYFLRVDRPWAQESLVQPLLKDDGASLALWRAIARRTHFTEVLTSIGRAMVERATDRRLGRETRRGLVFSLVVESLHAFREQREPAVPNPRIQQMLRTLDDEVRASAARAIKQFVRELSTSQPGYPPRPPAAGLFRSAAAPFLRDVWPQERSLVTPGVSGAVSDLPAASGEAFAEAVDVIERFLMPFECWSMNEYGLYGEEGGARKLDAIDDQAKAAALLRLLDLTVGESEGAIVPYDLSDALDQIRSVAPILSNSPVFRRLSTAARR